LPLKQETIH